MNCYYAHLSVLRYLWRNRKSLKKVSRIVFFSKSTSFTATENVHHWCGSQFFKVSNQNYLVFAWRKPQKAFLSSGNCPTIFQNLQGEMIFQNFELLFSCWASIWTVNRRLERQDLQQKYSEDESYKKSKFKIVLANPVVSFYLLHVLPTLGAFICSNNDGTMRVYNNAETCKQSGRNCSKHQQCDRKDVGKICSEK